MAKRKSREGKSRKDASGLVRQDLDDLKDTELTGKAFARLVASLADDLDTPNLADLDPHIATFLGCFAWATKFLDDSVVVVYAETSPRALHAAKAVHAETGLGKVWETVERAIVFCSVHQEEAFEYYEWLCSGDEDVPPVADLFADIEQEVEAASQQYIPILAAYIRAYPDVFCDD